MPNPNLDAESISWFRFALASVTVVGLMAGLAWLLKYFSMRGWLKAGQLDKRVKILSSVVLDTRRRVVLIQHDEVEHLLLLGPGNDLLLSSTPAKKHSSTVVPHDGKK